MSILNVNPREPTEFEFAQRFFYRMYFFAYKAGEHGDKAKAAGNDEAATTAQQAAKALGEQASVAYLKYRQLATKEEGRLRDVCVEEDMRLLMPEVYIAEAEGGYGLWGKDDDDEVGQ